MRNGWTEELLARAGKTNARVVFPESDDPRIKDAAVILAEGKILEPILIGEGHPIHGGVSLVSPRDEALVREQIELYVEKRAKKGIDLAQARKEALEPLMFAGMLVAAGRAEGAVAGALHPTASTIRAGLRTLGPAKGIATVSSTFLMQLVDGRLLSYADCGVVPDPTADELVDIVVASAITHRQLTGDEPRVALLSFSTLGSARHARVDKVIDALAKVKALDPSLIIDGELQFDAAFVPDVAKLKAPMSEVAGRANVYIFPDLDSGNIAYKITQRIGGATALGPLIQGLSRPYLDLSRGCSSEDIVLVGAIAAILGAC